MNDSIFQKNVRQLLDQSTGQIDQATLLELRQARNNAMENFKAHETAPVFAWAGWSGKTAASHRSLYYWLAAILFAVFVIKGASYLQHVRDNDDVEADIAILTDEMPIDVYLD